MTIWTSGKSIRTGELSVSERKVGVVTGAGKGIGKAIALALASQDYDLALIGRDTSTLDATGEECTKAGSRAKSYTLDLQNPSCFQRARDKIIEDFGQVDLLINNAGSGGGGNILEVDPERWDTCLQTNLIGLMHWTRVLAPEIIKSKAGAIINIASIASKITYGGGAAYAASKHGVAGFTGCLFEDVREYGVKVCAILPGFVDTDMVTNDSLNRGKMLAPRDVADAVTYVLNSSSRVCPTEIVLRPLKTPYQ